MYEILAEPGDCLKVNYFDPKKNQGNDFMKNTGTHFWEETKKKTQQQGCCGLHDTLNKDLIIVKSSNGAKLNLFFFLNFK